MTPALRPPDTAPASAGAPAPRPSGADAGLLLMVVIWALNFSVLKFALADLTPLALNALRFPLAALMVFAVLRSRGPIRLPPRSELGRFIVLGLLGNAMYQFLFIFGLDLTLAANAALLLAATPMLTALLSAVLGHERVGRPVWIGIIATFIGIGLVVLGGGERLTFRSGRLAGDLLMLGASVAWSIYTVGARGPIARHGSVTVTAWTLWIGTIFIVLAGLPDLARLDWAGVSALAWASTLYAGALGIGLAYLIWYRGVGRIGNTRTAVYGNLVPVVALPTAWLLLGEVPGPWQLVGAAVIIGGVTLARLR